MSVIDDWAQRVEEGEELAVIIVDQSAAYNTIDHKLLLKFWNHWDLTKTQFNISLVTLSTEDKQYIWKGQSQMNCI